MKKVLLLAYDMNPKIGSESGVVSIWLKIISKYYVVDVFTREIHRKAIQTESWPNVNFHYIRENEWFRQLIYKIGAHNISSALVIKKVKREIKTMLQDNYSLLHCLSPFALYSCNDLYKLGIPVLIGPVLGNLSTPTGFKRIVGGGILDYLCVREIAYKFIMKTRRWKNYFSNSVKIIAGNEGTRNYLPENVTGKCVVIYDLLVNVDFFKPGNNGKKEKKIVTVLFAGKLIRLKGIMLLVEACRICVEKGMDSFEIVIAGTGPLKETVQELIKKYSIQDYFKFVGRVDKDAMLKLYQDSDIYCLPTLRDNGGIAIVEAMACGLPVITSNYGGPAYSTTDETAIKINLSNYNNFVRDLAKALMCLIENKDLRMRMGKMGRERVKQKYSLQSLELQLINLYREVVDQI